MIASSPPLLPLCNDEPIKIVLLELLYIPSSERIDPYPHKFNFKDFSSKKKWKWNHRRFGIYLDKSHAKGVGELAKLQTESQVFLSLWQEISRKLGRPSISWQPLPLLSGFSPANLTVEGCLCWLCTILFPTYSLPSVFLTSYLQPPLSFPPTQAPIHHLIHAFISPRPLHWPASIYTPQRPPRPPQIWAHRDRRLGRRYPGLWAQE